MVILSPTVTLNNGKEMPVLGLGTWMLDERGSVVRDAIDVGYRSFDTAPIYDSEKPMGNALREKIAEGAVKREDLFISSKLWVTYTDPGMVVKACRASLEKLGLDYLDLFMMHWPLAFKGVNEPGDPLKSEYHRGMEVMGVHEFFPRDASGKIMFSDNDYIDTWKEMEKCVELGLAKSIGVSNFNAEQVDRLIKNSTIKPVVNQVECHPYFNQKKLRNFCKKRGVLITAYSPLGSSFPQNLPPNTPILRENPVILAIAEKYNKSPAQIILKFLVQMGSIVIPKTENPKRLLENISIFDFSLTCEEMAKMESLDCNARQFIIPGTEDHKYYPFNTEF